MRAFLLFFVLLASQVSTAYGQWPVPDVRPEVRSGAEAGNPYAIWQVGQAHLDRNAEGDSDAALELFRRARRGFADEDGPDGLRESAALERIGRLLAAMGRGAEAIETHRLWTEMLERRNAEPIDRARALLSLANLQKANGLMTDAVDTARQGGGMIAASGEGEPILAELRFTEAFALHSLGDYTGAMNAYRAAHSIWRGMGSDGEQSLLPALYNMLMIAEPLGLAEEAGEWRAEQAEIMRRIRPDTPDLADALRALARAEREQGDHDAALALVEEAIAARRKSRTETDEAMSLLLWDRGVSLYMLDRKDEAVAAYRKALAHLQRRTDETAADRVLLLGNIQAILDERNDTDGVRALALERIEILRGLDQPLVLAETIGRVAALDAQSNDLVAAAEMRREQVAILREVAPDSRELADALFELAFVLVQADDGTRAIPLADESVRIIRKAGADSRYDAVASQIVLGMALQRAGHFDSAMTALETSLDWLDTRPDADPWNRSVAYYRVADLARSLGRFAVAEEVGRRNVALLEGSHPGTSVLANAINDLADTLLRLSRYPEAIEQARRARTILVENGIRDFAYAQTYNVEGQALEGAGDYEDSLAIYERAAEAFSEVLGPESLEVAYVLNNAAWAYRRLEQLERSETDFRRAVEIIEAGHGPLHKFTAIAYLNVGILRQLRGDDRDAIRWTMRALASIEANRETTLEEQRWAYENLAKAFEGLGDDGRAILFAKLAINAQQKLRAHNKDYGQEQMRAFRDEWRRLYEHLADLLIRQGRLSEAQAVLAMEKEEELVDFVLRDSNADLRESEAVLTPGEEVARGAFETALQRPMAAAAALGNLETAMRGRGLTDGERADLARLEAALDEAYETFMDEVDAFLGRLADEDAAIQRETDALNLDYTADIQEELRAFGGRVAMLQVASLGEATHLFLTVPEAAIHRQVPVGREALSRKVFDALSALEARSPEARLRLAALYDVLVRPLRAEIDETGADKLMLNLQGFLRYVPFAALHDGKRYLVEDFSLSLFTPAARTEFAAAPRQPERSAGFGVTAPHPGFSPLPGVAREIQTIFGGALAGAASLDEAFTRDSFAAALRERPAIVHIASHFKLVPGRETDSFLLLGDGSPLTLADIRRGRGFRFAGVDLLTLSACQTAMGGGSDGGEVESFGALAQMNGASAVMATLWPVADEATAELMSNFYRLFVQDGKDKAAALRAAQVAMLRGEAPTEGEERGMRIVAREGRADGEGSRHPYFWSPFILMGNWL